MKQTLLALAITALTVQPAFSEEWVSVKNLRGDWKFSIGDQQAWAYPDFNDSSWPVVSVPGNWEDQGYAGYDGFAWYRIRFTLPERQTSKPLYLHLGYVDDASEVYLNGILIGKSGEFPPNYNTSFNNYQKYYIHPEWLRPGAEQVIAVRVYDAQLSGGIGNGRIGVFELSDGPELNVNMAGRWKFITGDSPDFKTESFDESGWTSLWVPGTWETQGFRGYDGLGWYRIRFKVPEYLINEPLVLLLGKVDDADEIWVNGCFGGRTGSLSPGGDFMDEYRQQRAYLMPPGTFTSGVNILAVRVYDNFLNGGIYEGPIGLISLERFRQWEKSSRYVEKNRLELIPAGGD